MSKVQIKMLLSTTNDEEKQQILTAEKLKRGIC